MAAVTVNVQSIENTQLELKTLWENLQACKQMISDCEKIYQSEKEDMTYTDAFNQWRVGYEAAYDLFKSVEFRMRGKDLSDVLVDDYLALIPPYVIQEAVGSGFTLTMDDTAGSLLITATDIPLPLFDYFLANDAVTIRGTDDGVTTGVDDGAYTINTVITDFQILFNEGRVIAPAYVNEGPFVMTLKTRELDDITDILNHTAATTRIVNTFNGTITRISLLQSILERMDARLIKLNTAINDMFYEGFEYTALNKLLFDAYTELQEHRLSYVEKSEVLAIRPRYVLIVDHEIIDFSYSSVFGRITLDTEEVTLAPDNFFADDFIRSAGSIEVNNNGIFKVDTVVSTLIDFDAPGFTSSSDEVDITLTLVGEYIA